MKEAREIKKLRTQLKSLDFEIKDIHEILANYQRTYESKKKQREEIFKQIQEHDMKLKVSEHAILRYLERVRGLNIEEIEAEILSESIVKSHQTLGDGTYPNGDYKVIIKGNNVTTIIK